MSWFKEGRHAAQMSPDQWREIGDRSYQKLCAERERKIKQLEYEGCLLRQEEQRCVADLNSAAARPLSVLRWSLFEGFFWLVVCGALIWASYERILSTLPLFSKSAGGQHVLAIILALGTAVAFEWFIRRLTEALPQHTLRAWKLFLGLIPVLFLVGSALIMSLMRGEYLATQGVLDTTQSAPVIIEGTAVKETPENKQEFIKAFYNRTGRLSVFLMFLMTAGLEIAVALTLHEALARIFPVWFTLGAHRRVNRIRRRMVQCASSIEHWRQEPEIMREEFARGAMLQVARQQAGMGSERTLLPQGAGLSIGLIAFILAFLVLFFILIRSAGADEFVVVAMDLTGSSQRLEFEENITAVNQVIKSLKPGSRLVIIPISATSFSEAIILDATLGRESGLFGERLNSAKQQLLRAWGQKSKALRPKFKSTDIFGALAKASVVFEESRDLKPVLIVLSDMRQAKGKYVFEKQVKVSPKVIDDVMKNGLVPTLKGARVWVLGVHARSVSQVYWMSLRAFWAEYFKRAGAELVMFTLNRRWNHE